MDQAGEHKLKRKIIDAARQVLVDDGYRNFSLRKVARNTGISATSIYLHFDNKDDLVHTLMEEAIERLNRRLEKRVKKSQDPIENLKDLAHEYADFALEHPREYQVIYVVSSDEMSRYPKEKFRKARKGYDIVTAVLEQAIQNYMINEERPGVASYTFWAQLHGVMSVVLSKRLDRRIDQQEFIDKSIRHIIDGYRINKESRSNQNTH